MKKGDASGPDIKKLLSYKDLPIGASSVGLARERNKTGSWRFSKPVISEKASPCERICPAGVPIKKFLALLRLDKQEEAFRVIFEENPFPGICGRVCYHPCETVCYRNKMDEAVAIHSLERMVGDYGLNSKIRTHLKPLPKKNGKIAVVGAGPAGLSCAFFLRQLGYSPEVFDALPQKGGTMRSAIPDFRLPAKVLDKEIQRLEQLGINFIMNTRIGRELSFEKVSRYDASFFSVGASRELHSELPDSNLKGVIEGYSFLRMIKRKKKIPLGKRVLIIGEGHAAIDCARAAVRLGVTPQVFFRKSRKVFIDQILEAEEEGIKFHFLVRPLKLIGEGNRLKAIKFFNNRPGKETSDNHRTVNSSKSSQYSVEADTVIFANNYACDHDFLPGSMIDEDGKLVVDSTGATNVPGIFAGGDIISQTRNVAHAIAAGKQGAISIDLYLKGADVGKELSLYQNSNREPLSIRAYCKGDPNSFLRAVVPFNSVNLSYFKKQARVAPKKRLPDKRKRDFKETNLTLSEGHASQEAKRCLSCGTCIWCDNCVNYCPDSSVIKGNTLAIDYKYCKGCGICENECPVGFIHMEKENME